MFWHGAKAQDWFASGQSYAWNNPDLIKDRELALKANQQAHVHQPQKSAMQIQKLIGSCNISAGLDVPLLGNMPSSLGCMMMMEQPSNTAAGARHWMATCTNNRVACATQTCHRQPLTVATTTTGVAETNYISSTQYLKMITTDCGGCEVLSKGYQQCYFVSHTTVVQMHDSQQYVALHRQPAVHQCPQHGPSDAPTFP